MQGYGPTDDPLYQTIRPIAERSGTHPMMSRSILVSQLYDVCARTSVKHPVDQSQSVTWGTLKQRSERT